MKTTQNQFAVYTESQIQSAQSSYNEFLQYRTAESYNPAIIGWAAAEQRSEYHNNIVKSINNGNKVLEKEWKLYFLKKAAIADAKIEKQKAKVTANKLQSADVLAPIKKAKRLVEFGKWLNSSGNKFRSEHFSKKYTQESVSAFLNK